MAQPQLNPDLANLDPTSDLYNLYSRFYNGMKEANQYEGPDYVTSPPLTPAGEIDVDAISTGMAEYSDILMKNSAYMLANSVMSVFEGGGGGSGSPGGGRYVARAGDSMAGLLSALYGFKAGYSGELVFETLVNDKQQKLAYVYGDLNIEGRLNLGDEGVYFANYQVFNYKDGVLQVQANQIELLGATSVDGEFSVGDVSIKDNAIFNGVYEYYHAGNCNNDSTDWSMLDAYVYGNLTVNETASFEGRITALKGFDLGEDGVKLLYSVKDPQSSYLYIESASDFALMSGYGIKYDGNYIIRPRGNDIISISAPSRIINLGDSDGGIDTAYIALQTSIKNYSGDYDIVTQYGDGNFRNSLSAGCGNAGATVLQTYFKTSDDCGVIFHRNIRIGGEDGPIVKAGTSGNVELVLVMSYTHNTTQLPVTEQIPFYINYQDTTSLFKDQSREWSASLNFNTEAEFFTFVKPVESVSFSIMGEKYKTRLLENTLFFNDGIFLEGMADGVRMAGNAYFDANLSSMRFASGFAGYGWAIMQSELVGGYTATFDELTIRKKARFYEFEVQKQSVTNGSLWVSDACSGDLVEELI